MKITDGDWSKVNVADPYTDKDGQTMFKIGYGEKNDPLYVIMGEYNTPFGASQYKGDGEPMMSCTIGNQRDAKMNDQVAGIEKLKTAILSKMVKTNGYKIRGIESTAPYTVEELQQFVSGPITTREKYDDKSGTVKKYEPEMRVKFPTIRENKKHIGLVERYNENAPPGTPKGLPLIVHVTHDDNGKEVKRRMKPELENIEELVPKKSRIQLVAQIRHVLFKPLNPKDNKERLGSFRIDAVRVVRLGESTVAVQAPPVMDGFDDLKLDEEEAVPVITAEGSNDDDEDNDEEDDEEEEGSGGEDSDASAYTKSKKK